MSIQTLYRPKKNFNFTSNANSIGGLPIHTKNSKLARLYNPQSHVKISKTMTDLGRYLQVPPHSGTQTCKFPN